MTAGARSQLLLRADSSLLLLLLLQETGLSALALYLLAVRADLDGVGDELGGLLLGDGRHVFQLDGDLDAEAEMSAAPRLREVHARVCTCVCTCGTYSGLPAEDVAVEAEPVLGQVQAALQQDVLLQSAGVVWSRHSSSADTPEARHRRHATRVSLTHDEPLRVGKFLEDFAEVLVPLFVGGAENLRVRREFC